MQKLPLCHDNVDQKTVPISQSKSEMEINAWNFLSKYLSMCFKSAVDWFGWNRFFQVLSIKKRTLTGLVYVSEEVPV